MNAGIDFETKILVKFDAAKLLRAELNRSSWTGELLAMSGVTDCYQPAERRFKLTRGLLEVMHEANQAVAIVTKNALVLCDLDLLADMARRRLVHVCMSVTTLDDRLARALEPRTSSPAARLRAIAALSEAGVPVRVLMAPLIPGLTDHEVPRLLKAVKEAGAHAAGYVLLRLPHAVAPIFLNWLSEHRTLVGPKVEGLIRAARDGDLYRSEWGKRMRGSGADARQRRVCFAPRDDVQALCQKVRARRRIARVRSEPISPAPIGQRTGPIVLMGVPPRDMSFHHFKLFAEVGDGLAGTQVEDGATFGDPFIAAEQEDAGGRSQSADVFILFHVATFDGREADRHRYERPQLARDAIAGEGDVVVELAVDPHQPARLAAGSGDAEKASLQPFTAEMEQSLRLF
jgi:DNA repair photolyase